MNRLFVILSGAKRSRRIPSIASITGFLAGLGMTVGGVLLLALPAAAQVSSEVEGLALSAVDPRIIAARIIRVALGFLGVLTLSLIVYGGVVWMTAAGNEERMAKAKKILTNAIIGLVIILSAFAITQFILSKLVEATQGPGVGTSADDDGAGGGLSADAFTVKGIQPQGEISSKKIIVKITLSDAPDPLTAKSPNITVTRVSDDSAVAGEFKVGPLTIAGKTLNLSDRTVTFLPAAPCPEAPDYRCFDPEVEYRVKVVPGALKRARDRKEVFCGLTSVCEVTFTSGTEVDLTPPEVTLRRSPASISNLGFATLQADMTDNGGVALAEFYSKETCPAAAETFELIDAVSPTQGTPQSAVLTTAWFPSEDAPTPSMYDFFARGYDTDTGVTDTDKKSVVVRADHCFDEEQNFEETGVDCGGPPAACGGSLCGSCLGDACEDDSDCADSYICEIPTEETEGTCVLGAPEITGVSPGNGRAGTFVTIAGLNFGAAPRRVYFTGPDDTLIEAQLPAQCQGSDALDGNYILVAVPDSAVDGPITVTTADNQSDQSNDDNGLKVPVHNAPSPRPEGVPEDGSFDVNDAVRPGLCSVKTPPEGLPQGGWGMRVEVSGAQFGAQQIGEGRGNVLFSGVPGLGIDNWSDAGALTAVPPISYGPAQVQVRDAQGVFSNALPYRVLSPDAGTLPEISSITPDAGGIGQGLTITGRNFGTNPGVVWFVGADDDSVPADTALPLQCGSTWWLPTAITVKVPQSLAQADFDVYVQRCGSGPNLEICDNAQSNRKPFEVTNTPAGPFLACMRPLGGPAFTNVSVYGENLGASVNVANQRGLLFTHENSPTILAYNPDGGINSSWSGALATLTNTGGVGGDECPQSGWSSTEVCVQVPGEEGNSARTGAVLAEQDIGGLTRRSNPLSFTVGSCLAPPGDPLRLECTDGTQCCGDGSCNTECPEIITPKGAYGWQFTTASAPLVPRVLEQCDQTMGEGHPLYPPSPAPWATSGRIMGAEACVNAAVTVNLSVPVLASTLTSDTVKIEQCTGSAAFVTGANSNFGDNAPIWGPPPDPTPDPNATNTCRGVDEVECERHWVAERIQGLGRGATLTEDPGNYALRLTKLDDDTGPGWPNALRIQRNYEHWFGYEAALGLETDGKTYTVSAWMRAGSATALGKRAGILIQRNNSVGGNPDDPGFWQKSVSEITLTDSWQKVSASITFDSGPNSSGPGFVRVFMEGSPYDIRVPESAPNPLELFSVLVDDVEVQGDPCAESVPVALSSGAFEIYPNNSGFRFWPNPALPWQTGSWYRVTLLGGSAGITAADAFGRTGLPMEVLDGAGALCGDGSAAYCFRFRTGDTDELCEVGGIAVVPNPWTARQENERIDYSAFPVSATDPCIALSPAGYGWQWASSDTDKAKVSFTSGTLGQLCSDSAQCSIGRNVCANKVCSDNQAVACNADSDCAGAGSCIELFCASGADCGDAGGACTVFPACSQGAGASEKSCLYMPWTTTATALEDTAGAAVDIKADIVDQTVQGISELFIEFEPPRVVAYWPSCGEACLNAAAGARFNIAMLDTPDPASVTDENNVALWSVPCGNGVLERGEDCDDGNTVSGDGCGDTCLNEGSYHALRCGNGVVNTFEDCDDDNVASGDGCSERCLNEGSASSCGNRAVDSGEECDDGNTQSGDGCSNLCLHEGTRSDLAICGNRRLDRGEECEANFDGSFANWCNSTSCLRQGPTETLRCGNGRLDDGEECDRSSPLLDTPAKQALCTSSCQWTGTLPPQRLGGQGCGNGTVELGEDCDDGGRRPGDGCSEICTNEGSAGGSVRACGNGVVETGEDCDDGNIADGDGCSLSCLNEGRLSPECGNGIVEVSEDCDRDLTPATCTSLCLNIGANPVACAAPLSDRPIGTTCSTQRPFNTCGNGVREDGEDCDDGNLTAGDGCSAICTNEGRLPTTVNGLTLSYNSSARELEIGLDSILQPLTLYRVLLRGDNPESPAVEGIRSCRGVGCATAGKALDPASLNFYYNWDAVGNPPAPPAFYDGSEPANTFSWTFRTGEGVCAVARVDVAPPDLTLYVIGARQQYSSVPYGVPDSCDPRGQRLNAFGYNWGWNTADTVVAKIVGGVPGVDIIPSCGNGLRERGEDCDDGNTVAGDGCTSACLNEGSNFSIACGDGNLDPGEECDVPGDTEQILCTSSCQRTGIWVGGAICGNGAVQQHGTGIGEGIGEDCDDGNTTPGDGCSPRCLNEGSSTQTGECGNGIVDTASGEECDPAAVNNAASPYCNPQTCLFRGTPPRASCGNGVSEWGEDCDDGNLLSGDGCSGSAASARCVNEGSNPARGSVCGNSRVELGEDCDDGNTQNGDGCSSACLNEGTDPVTPPASNPNQPNAGVDPWQFARAEGILKFCRTSGGQQTAQACTMDSECDTNTGQICAPPHPWSTTEVQATAVAEGITGQTPLTVMCGARTEADCPVPGGAAPSATVGRGSDTCCYLRPAVAERLPASGATEVCRNGLLRLTFNTRMDSQSLSENIVLARAYSQDSSAAVGQGCPVGTRQLQADGTLGDLVPEPVAVQTDTAPRGFFARLWNWVRIALRRVLPNAFAQADPVVWCVDPQMRLSPQEGISEISGNSVSVVTLQPSRILGDSDDEVRYRVALLGDRDLEDGTQEGLRSAFGVSFAGVDQTWSFTVSTDICTLDEVELIPDGGAFTSSGQSIPVSAAAWTRQRGRQQIQPVSGYSWTWSWGSSENEVASVTSATEEHCGGFLYGDDSPCAAGVAAEVLTSPHQTVTAGSRDGTAVVNARATIVSDFGRLGSDIGAVCTTAGKCSHDSTLSCTTADDCGAQTGRTVTGVAEFTTLLCDNPWPADAAAQYRFADTEGAPSPLGGARAMNFSTRYCRDGETLLPELSYPGAVLTPAVSLESSPFAGYGIAAVGTPPLVLKEYLLTTRTFQPEAEVDSVDGNAILASSDVSSIETEGGAAFSLGNANFDYGISIPADGDYELTLETSNKDQDLSNLAAILDERNVSTAVRYALANDINEGARKLHGAQYHRMEIWLDNQFKGTVVNRASSSARGALILSAIGRGTHTVSVRWTNDARLPASGAYANDGYAAGEIWDSNLKIHRLTLKSGRAKDEALGVRVLANPDRLSPLDWYRSSGFAGTPAPVPGGIDGYPAVREGNTVYAAATNVSPPDAGVRQVYGNIYAVLLAEGASAPVRAIFDQVLQNFELNANLDDSNTCAQDFCANAPAVVYYTNSGSQNPDCGPAVQRLCDTDRACAVNGSIECQANKAKLKRDLARLSHLGILESALSAYKVRTGRFPTLQAGTFIRSMTVSPWSSWQGALGAELGVPLPIDPLNIFAEGCAADSPGGPFNPATCFNERTQIFRCPQGSRVYQYRSQGGESYILSAEFELLERASAGGTAVWDLDGWSPGDSLPDHTIETSGICEWGAPGDLELSNAEPICGNQIIEGVEECEPRGEQTQLVSFPGGELRCSGKPSVTCASIDVSGVGVVDVDGDGVIEGGDSCGQDSSGAALGTCRLLTSCTAVRDCGLGCGWDNWLDGTSPTAADCASGGAFCGNGLRDDYDGDGALDEACDDGLLNGTYGKCQSDCSGLGDYCGDGTRNGPEVCDDGTLNGTYNHCRFDCAGVGGTCGDGVVQEPDEQCEEGDVEELPGICTGGSFATHVGCAGNNDDDCPTGETCNLCVPSRVCIGGTFPGRACSDNSDCPGPAGGGVCSEGTLPTARRRRCRDAGSSNQCTWGFYTGHCYAQLGVGCGNGTREGSEQCDDGNTVNEDGCTNACTIAVCGDAVSQGSVCSGNSETAGDACAADTECGDGGRCSDRERCDLGAQNGELCAAPYGGSCTYCDRQCNVSALSGGICGDGIRNGSEICDGSSMTDLSLYRCISPNFSSYVPSSCQGDCTAPACGEGDTFCELGVTCAAVNITIDDDGILQDDIFEVTIDGVEVGSAGAGQEPLSFPALPVGEHTVRITYAEGIGLGTYGTQFLPTDKVSVISKTFYSSPDGGLAGVPNPHVPTPNPYTGSPSGCGRYCSKESSLSFPAAHPLGTRYYTIGGCRGAETMYAGGVAMQSCQWSDSCFARNECLKSQYSPGYVEYLIRVTP